MLALSCTTMHQRLLIKDALSMSMLEYREGVRARECVHTYIRIRTYARARARACVCVCVCVLAPVRTCVCLCVACVYVYACM